MTTTTAGRVVDGADANLLAKAYRSLVKAGTDSVRAAWRFGQCIDSFTDTYTQLQLADALELSVSTLHRYLRLYRAYARPELAVQAGKSLETYNIDLITELQNQLKPVDHRPLAGRRFRYRCLTCHSKDVHREEITDPAELAELDRAEALVDG